VVVDLVADHVVVVDLVACRRLIRPTPAPPSLRSARAAAIHPAEHQLDVSRLNLGPQVDGGRRPVSGAEASEPVDGKCLGGAPRRVRTGATRRTPAHMDDGLVRRTSLALRRISSGGRPRLACPTRGVS
jgi:hypothetical protein